MRRLMLAAGALCMLAAPALAKEECAQEPDVRRAAVEIDATEVVPLRGKSGRPFLMLILRSGDGLVMAKSDKGCFDMMLAMPKEAVNEVLTQSAPT